MDFDAEQFLEEEFTNVEQEQNVYLANASKGLSLITRLIAIPSTDSHAEQQQRLLRFHHLIHDDFLTISSQDDFPGKTAAFRELLGLQEALTDIVAFPYLATKTIIGVGGGFSVGKSRFLNTLCGISLLPEALEPSTAIPTYLTHGNKQSIVALNAFNFEAELDVPALNAVSHAFHHHYRDALGEDVGFAHMLRVLMIQQPHFVWQNLALLDTPGYSKADAHTNQSDAELAQQQLSEADHIIWLVSAKNGSVREDDIAFIRTLNHKKPIFLVITQADLIPTSKLTAVINVTRDAFAKAQIGLAGLMAWQAPISLNEAGCVHGDDIRQWLSKMNEGSKRTGMVQECERIIDACIDHNQKRLKENQEQLSLLNKLTAFSQLVSLRADMTAEDQAELQRMVDNQKTIQQKRKSQIDEFSKIRTLMVYLIKTIVEVYGTILLPDTSDVSVSTPTKSNKQQKEKMPQGKKRSTEAKAPRDKKAALVFVAASFGDAEAQFKLGWMYDNGKHVQKDEWQAAEWYSKAAVQGHVEAQFLMGVMYANGWGLEVDAVQAADWMQKAAQQGHAEAQYNLAVMYNDGRGIPSDRMKAKAWLKKAIGQGHQRAGKLLATLQ